MYHDGYTKNRESRGRRPRLSLKEEKKRFRPSGYTIYDPYAYRLVSKTTQNLRIPYGA